MRIRTANQTYQISASPYLHTHRRTLNAFIKIQLNPVKYYFLSILIMLNWRDCVKFSKTSLCIRVGKKERGHYLQTRMVCITQLPLLADYVSIYLWVFNAFLTYTTKGGRLKK